MNRILSRDEWAQRITEVIARCAAREGVSPDEFIARMCDEWNAALAEDDD